MLVYHDDPTTDVTSLIPVADSVYSNVKIPIILIKNQDGRRMMQEKGEMFVLLHLDSEASDSANTAEAEVWLNPAALDGYDFVLKFREHWLQVKQQVSLRVRYKYKDLAAESQRDEKHCFANGRFCATETLGFDPLSILEEGVRQICILQQSEAEANDLQLWFHYVRGYRDCVRNKLNSLAVARTPCFETVTRQQGFAPSVLSDIETCEKKSYENRKDPQHSRNYLLETHINNFEYSKVYLVPALFINGKMVKEHLTPRMALSAICDILINKPGVCLTHFTSQIDWNYARGITFRRGLNALIWVVCCGLASMLLIYVAIKKFAKYFVNYELRQEVRTHVTEYMKVKDGN